MHNYLRAIYDRMEAGDMVAPEGFYIDVFVIHQDTCPHHEGKECNCSAILIRQIKKIPETIPAHITSTMVNIANAGKRLRYKGKGNLN